VVLTFLAASIPMAVTVVKANSVVLTQGNYSYDVGGEFTAVTTHVSLTFPLRQHSNFSGVFQQPVGGEFRLNLT
jgi:hypothetical protein